MRLAGTRLGERVSYRATSGFSLLYGGVLDRSGQLRFPTDFKIHLLQSKNIAKLNVAVYPSCILYPVSLLFKTICPGKEKVSYNCRRHLSLDMIPFCDVWKKLGKKRCNRIMFISYDCLIVILRLLLQCPPPFR